MAALGEASLVALALGAALPLLGALGGWLAGRRAPLAATIVRVALPILALLAAAATAALAWALATSDFTVAYVAAQSRRGGSLGYRLAGLWGGMAGSLLLWIALLGVVAVVTCRAVRRSVATAELVPAVGAVFVGLMGSFAAVLVVWAPPFERLDLPPLDGRGLTPILEHPAMLYHPPILYFGLISLAAPFAVTIAAGLARRLDRDWLALCRRSMLVSWTLLALGMLAGAHWAYVELGWGGFWAWDPVENTALLPWLAATAFLHQGVRHREPPSGSPVVLPVLVVTAFVLALVGTTLTRSGAAPSVHAFAEDATIGWALAVIAATAAVLAAIVIGRSSAGLGRARPGPAPGASRRRLPSFARLRDLALSAQVALVLLVLVIVATGTVYPAVASDAVAVSGHYFAVFCGPIALGLLVLMVGARRWPGRSSRVVTALVVSGAATAGAVALALGWRGSFALVAVGAAVVAGGSSLLALARERRPAHLAHLGFVLLMVGIAGTTTTQSIAGTLAPGEELAIGGYTVRNEGTELHDLPGLGNHEVVARVTIERGGRAVARLEPSLLVRRTRALVLAETALRSTPLDDVQVALRNAGDGGEALLEVAVRPLVWWVWWGALLLVAGGGWTALAGVREARRCSKPTAAVAGAGPGPAATDFVASRPRRSVPPPLPHPHRPPVSAGGDGRASEGEPVPAPSGSASTGEV